MSGYGTASKRWQSEVGETVATVQSSDPTGVWTIRRAVESYDSGARIQTRKRFYVYFRDERLSVAETIKGARQQIANAEAEANEAA